MAVVRAHRDLVGVKRQHQIRYTESRCTPCRSQSALRRVRQRRRPFFACCLLRNVGFGPTSTYAQVTGGDPRSRPCSKFIIIQLMQKATQQQSRSPLIFQRQSMVRHLVEHLWQLSNASAVVRALHDGSFGVS